jgi:hypothetical protein
MTDVEMALETSAYSPLSYLTWLIAGEHFIQIMINTPATGFYFWHLRTVSGKMMSHLLTKGFSPYMHAADIHINVLHYDGARN